MSELRSVATFFRISLNDAIRFMTDLDCMRYGGEWRSSPFFQPGQGW